MIKTITMRTIAFCSPGKLCDANSNSTLTRQSRGLCRMETLIVKRALEIYALVVSIAIVSSQSCSNAPFYVDCVEGDVVLAGLFSIHDKTAKDECDTTLNAQQLANAEAMIYAIEQVNKNPYLLSDIRLGYRIFDTCGIPARANVMAFSFVINNALNKHMQEINATQEEFNGFLQVNVSKRPIALVIGPVDSASSVVVANTLQVGNLPLISPSATSDELGKSHFRTFFRTVPPDSQQAKAISDIIEYFNWTHIAIIGSDSSYGRFGVHALEHEAHDRDTYCIHSIEYIPLSGYERKIQKIVSKLKRAVKVQVIVLWAGDISSIHFLFRESLKQQLFGRTWIASDGWSDTTSLFTPQYSAVIGGFIGTTFQQFNVSGFEKHLLATNLSSTRIKDNVWWNEFLRSVSNCSQLVWKGCREHVARMSSDLFSLMKSASLAYVIDAVQAAAHAIDSAYPCQRDQTNLSQVTCSRSQFHSIDVSRALRKVQFQGLTGSISFDDNGDSLRSAAYDVVNLRVVSRNTPLLNKVGTWNKARKKRLQLPTDGIRWKNGSTVIPTSRCSEFCPPGTRQTSAIACCWECIPCRSGKISTSYSSTNCTPCKADEKSTHNNTKCEELPLDNIVLKDVRGMSLLVIVGIGVLLTLCTLGVFVKYRDTPVVKSSNRELSYLFLVSILIAFLAASVLVNGPTPFSCVTNMLLHTIVFNLCISILFLRTSRLLHAFNSQTVLKSKTHWFYNRNYQFVALGILNLFPVVLITIFLVIKPPSVQVTIVPFQYKILQCWVFTTTEIVITCAVYAYEFFLSVSVAYYAFRARKLPSNFNETKYIAFNMYVQLTTCVTTFAVFTNLRPGSLRAILNCLVQLCRAYSFLLCIFAPKLFIIFRHPEKNTLDYFKAAVARNTMKRCLSNSLTELRIVSATRKTRSRTETSSPGLSGSSHSGWPVTSHDEENKRVEKDHVHRRATWDDSSPTGFDIRNAINSRRETKGTNRLINQAKRSSSDILKENGREVSSKDHEMVGEADLAFFKGGISLDSSKDAVVMDGSANDDLHAEAQDTRL